MLADVVTGKLPFFATNSLINNIINIWFDAIVVDRNSLWEINNIACQKTILKKMTISCDFQTAMTKAMWNSAETDDQ